MEGTCLAFSFFRSVSETKDHFTDINLILLKFLLIEELLLLALSTGCLLFDLFEDLG